MGRRYISEWEEGTNPEYITLAKSEYSIDKMLKLASLGAQFISQVVYRTRSRDIRNGNPINPKKEWFIKSWYIIDNKRYFFDIYRHRSQKEAFKHDMDEPVPITREDIELAKSIFNY